MRGTGRLGSRFSIAFLGAMAMLIAVPSSGSAATQIGETFPPHGSCSADFLFLQSQSPGARYSAPTAGVITSWSYHSMELPSLVGPLKFKVGRPAPGADLTAAANFTIVGESELRTPAVGTLNTYPTRIPVQAGDVIGFFFAEVGGCAREIDPGFTSHFHEGDVPPGGTEPFDIGSRHLDVSALLELDCDSDGFGDETQDTQFTGASPCPEVRCKGELATIVGTDGNNEISGTGKRDVIAGLGGRDAIRGLAGKDLICGGPNKDLLKGGKGKDKLFGQGGKDKLRGGGAKDVCKGGKGDDSAKCEVEKSI